MTHRLRPVKPGPRAAKPIPLPPPPPSHTTVHLIYSSDRSKNYIYVNSLPSATLWIVFENFRFFTFADPWWIFTDICSRLKTRQSLSCDSLVFYKSNLRQWICKNRKRQLSEYFVSISPGNGTYAYLEASFPRQHGDNVRLLSPIMQGAKCMSFMYHMYGSSMGSLVIYMKTNSSETVEWIKTGHHPNQWLEAVIFLNSSALYQVIHLTDKLRKRAITWFQLLFACAGLMQNLLTK